MRTTNVWLVVLGACLVLGGQAWGLERAEQRDLGAVAGAAGPGAVCTPCECRIHDPGNCNGEECRDGMYWDKKSDELKPLSSGISPLYRRELNAFKTGVRHVTEADGAEYDEACNNTLDCVRCNNSKYCLNSDAEAPYSAEDYTLWNDSDWKSKGCDCSG